MMGKYAAPVVDCVQSRLHLNQFWEDWISRSAISSASGLLNPAKGSSNNNKDGFKAKARATSNLFKYPKGSSHRWQFFCMIPSPTCINSSLANSRSLQRFCTIKALNGESNFPTGSKRDIVNKDICLSGLTICCPRATPACMRWTDVRFNISAI